MAWKNPGKLTAGPTGMAPADGNRGHLPGCREGPDGDSDCIAIIAQWCFPPRRQHAGSFESRSEANTTGLISEKLNRAISNNANVRRIDAIVAFFAISARWKWLGARHLNG
jgi:hypothetical protein